MDNELLNEVLDEFKALTLIPRKSCHEKEVSEYLQKRFNELGFSATSDDANNVIAEKKVNDVDKFIILQGHMDMVCTYNDDIDFDPLKDHIEYVIDGNKMHAKGTTLGADDGIGLAMAIVLAKHSDKNIRIIATTDEEDGMTGAIALDSKYLDGKYLINIDWEDADTICNSSACGRRYEATKEINVEEEIDNYNDYSLLEISLKELAGGHSGSDIDKDITNAIRANALFIKDLIEEKIDVNLRDIEGGSASNAIPTKCISHILVKKDDIKKVTDMFNVYKAKYNDGDKFTINEIDMYDKDVEDLSYIKTISKKETYEVVSFISNIINGPYSLEPTYNIVESSSNIGTVDTILDDSSDKIIIKTNSLLRSCNDSMMDEIDKNYHEVAKDNNFTLEMKSDNPSWPIKDGKLTKACMDAYNYVNNKEVKLVQVHAGLECSFFSIKNRNLEMISVGPTLEGVHSPKETLFIDTIMPIYNMIARVIDQDF